MIVEIEAGAEKQAGLRLKWLAAAGMMRVAAERGKLDSEQIMESM
jgi:hypothetical protein